MHTWTNYIPSAGSNIYLHFNGHFPGEPELASSPWFSFTGRELLG